MEQRWRAVCIEKCKHGSGRGLHKPTLEIRKGGAFLLYYAGNNRMYHAGDPIGYADLTGSYWQQHLIGAGWVKTN